MQLFLPLSFDLTWFAVQMDVVSGGVWRCLVLSLQYTFCCTWYISLMCYFSLKVLRLEYVETQGSLLMVPDWEGKNLRPRAFCVLAVRQDIIWLAQLRGRAFTMAAGVVHSQCVKVGSKEMATAHIIWWSCSGRIPYTLALNKKKKSIFLSYYLVLYYWESKKWLFYWANYNFFVSL